MQFVCKLSKTLNLIRLSRLIFYVQTSISSHGPPFMHTPKRQLHKYSWLQEAALCTCLLDLLKPRSLHTNFVRAFIERYGDGVEFRQRSSPPTKLGEKQKHFNFNFNFILPNVNTDYMRQAQVLNIDKLRLIINLRKFNENVK